MSDARNVLQFNAQFINAASHANNFPVSNGLLVSKFLYLSQDHKIQFIRITIFLFFVQFPLYCGYFGANVWS